MKTIDLKTYRENAAKENLCAEFTKKWDSCVTNKELIDMALSSKGIDYLCDSIAKGWGITPIYLASRFKNFINGCYVSDQQDYESEMYCRYKGGIVAKTANIAVIDCDMDIVITDFFRCDIYVSGKSNIRVKGKGEVVLICYGEEADIVHEFSQGLRAKRLNKKNRDTYE